MAHVIRLQDAKCIGEINSKLNNDVIRTINSNIHTGSDCTDVHTKYSAMQNFAHAQ